MQPIQSVLALALALLPLAAPQDKPPPKTEPGASTKWPWGNAKEAERIANDFCGVWQLMRLDLGGETYNGARCAGYLLAMPGYCSLQVRLLDTKDPDPRLAEPGFSAGTFRWEYDGSRLMLVMTTQINANDIDDPTRRVMYEPPGARREYRVDLAGDDLTLDRGHGNLMVFHRLQKAAATTPAPTPATEGKR